MKRLLSVLVVLCGGAGGTLLLAGDLRGLLGLMLAALLGYVRWTVSGPPHGPF